MPVEKKHEVPKVCKTGGHIILILRILKFPPQPSPFLGTMVNTKKIQVLYYHRKDQKYEQCCVEDGRLWSVYDARR